MHMCMKLADAHQEQNIAKPPKGDKNGYQNESMLVLSVENKKDKRVAKLRFHSQMVNSASEVLNRFRRRITLPLPSNFQFMKRYGNKIESIGRDFSWITQEVLGEPGWVVPSYVCHLGVGYN